MTKLCRNLLLVCLALAFPINALAQADQAISASDSPDPVTPGANVTYAITVTNNGPNPAVNGGFNASFTTPTYVSATGPAGFTCSVFGNNVSCTNPSFAPGTANFTLVLNVPQSLQAFPDGNFTTNFSTSGVTPDPVGGNNNVNVTTSYDSPQSELSLTATDSPDPVFPDGDITYTVTVTNGGPQAAQNTRLNVPLNNTLLVTSVSAPAGFTCLPAPVPGMGSSFTCTNPSMAVGTAVFTIVLRANDEQFGINDGTINQFFGVNSDFYDSNHANESVTVSTAYVTPDADISVTATDSPDPVFPDGDITYTVTVTNAGPNTAPNTNFNVPLNNTLRVTSVTPGAGFTCTPPPTPGQGTSFTCSNPSFAVGSSVFTIVLRANDEQFGIFDQTINQVFSANSSISDPNNPNNTIQVSTAYVTPDANLSIAATDSPDPVAPDGDITYTVTLANAGPDAAPNTILNVPLNNTLRVTSVTVPAGFTCTPPPVVGQGTSFSCSNPSFASGANAVFTIVLRANDEQFGIHDQAINQAFTVGSSVTDPNNDNNSIVVTTQYDAPNANLSITATDSPDPVANGNNLTFTINLGSTGPQHAMNLQMIASPHPSLTFQSLSAPPGYLCTTPAVNASGPVICSIPAFANGDVSAFTLVTRLVTAQPSGVLNSNFSVGSGTSDPVLANNSVEVFTNFINAVSDLQISKTTGATSAARGGTIPYSITITNAGPDAANNVVVTDVLPAQLLFHSITEPAGFTCTTPAVGTNGTITCTAATFANGATANFFLVTTVANNATGPISNSASVGASGIDPASGNSAGAAGNVTIAGDADVGVSKTTAATSVAPGGTFSYTIGVTNLGPDIATNVVMTDVLPASLEFQSITEPAGFTCTTPAVNASGTITCTAATLAAGPTATFTLTVRVAAGATGTITNTAGVSSSSTDGNGTNGSATTAPVPVSAAGADVRVTKTTAATQAPTGSTMNWTITVTNNGPATATNVVVTDTLPASLQFISATPTQGTCSGTTTITCNLGSLVNNAVATIVLSTRVVATSGVVSNGATVSAATTDPNGGNNTTSTTEIPVVPSLAPQEAQIPTLSEWSLLLFAAALGIAALFKMRS